MRDTLLPTGNQSALDLSDAPRSAACDMLGCGLTANAWEQATLPIRHGGMGIKDPTTLRPVARLAALANFHARGTIVGAPPYLLEHISDEKRWQRYKPNLVLTTTWRISGSPILLYYAMPQDLIYHNSGGVTV